MMTICNLRILEAANVSKQGSNSRTYVTFGFMYSMLLLDTGSWNRWALRLMQKNSSNVLKCWGSFQMHIWNCP